MRNSNSNLSNNQLRNDSRAKVPWIFGRLLQRLPAYTDQRGQVSVVSQQDLYHGSVVHCVLICVLYFHIQQWVMSVLNYMVLYDILLYRILYVI